MLTALPLADLIPCDRQPGWGCLGVGLVLLAVAAVVALLASWLMLRLAGVRPAWQVAAVVGLLSWLWGELSDRAYAWSASTALLPLTSAALFALAAVLTAPRPVSWRPRIALLAVGALLWPLSALVGDHRADASRRSELVDVGVPLFAPDIAGYRIEHPMATRHGPWFGFVLWPKRADVDTKDPNSWTVRVTVTPLQPRFQPPACEAVDLGSTVRGTPCEQVAANTWRTVNPYVLFYFVRREGFVIVLSADGKHVTDADLRTLASTLAVRDPDFFLR
ncbi:hypothetical protein [Streptomyces melanogenes]|uniref:hypothetical protein n=1 Tax=Streptomyces melanogenes TaxID=67326 RepID=UPI0037AF3AEC